MPHTWRVCVGVRAESAFDPKRRRFWRVVANGGDFPPPRHHTQNAKRNGYRSSHFPFSGSFWLAVIATTSSSQRRAIITICPWFRSCRVHGAFDSSTPWLFVALWSQEGAPTPRPRRSSLFGQAPSCLVGASYWLAISKARRFALPMSLGHIAASP